MARALLYTDEESKEQELCSSLKKNFTLPQGVTLVNFFCALELVVVLTFTSPKGVTLANVF